MASIHNSIKFGDVSFTGNWEDVKDYSSLVITLKAPANGNGLLQWANTARRQFPSDDDVIATDNFKYTANDPRTYQWDHRGQWFRLLYTLDGSPPENFNDMSLNISTMYKVTPTEFKIANDGQEIIDVIKTGGEGNIDGHSWANILTDGTGSLIRTTHEEQLTGSALYTHLSDASGVSLSTTSRDDVSMYSLHTALRDGNGQNYSTLVNSTSGIGESVLYIHPSDVCGHSQGATEPVIDASSGVGALYLAGADNCGATITSIKSADPDIEGVGNSLYVSLVDASGKLISFTNPLHVEGPKDITGVFSFDISNGVQDDFVKVRNGGTNIFNLNTYNDGPTTAWLKLYDLTDSSVAQFTMGAIKSVVALTPDTLPEIGSNPSRTEPYTASVVQSGSAGSGGFIKFVLTDSNDVGSVAVATNSGDTIYAKSFGVSDNRFGADYHLGVPLDDGFEATATAGDISGFNMNLKVIPITSYSSASAYIKSNIAIPAGTNRDLSFPKGTFHTRGLYFRATTQHTYESSQSPGESTIFVSGTYYINEDSGTRDLDTKSMDINQFDVQQFMQEQLNTREMQEVEEPETAPVEPNMQTPTAEPLMEPAAQEPMMETDIQTQTAEPLMEPEVQEQSEEPVNYNREYTFRSASDNVEGQVNFIYNSDTSELDTNVLLTTPHPLVDIVMYYDTADGELAEVDVDTTDFVSGQTLSIGTIPIDLKELQSLNLTIRLGNNAELSIPYTSN